MEIPKSLELVRIICNLVITTQSSIFFAFILSEQVQKSCSWCVEPCTKEQQLHSNRTLLAHSLCLLASFGKLVASDT